MHVLLIWFARILSGADDARPLEEDLEEEVVDADEVLLTLIAREDSHYKFCSSKGLIPPVHQRGKKCHYYH